MDWERADAGHPYLDLATISNFLSLPDEVAAGLGGIPTEERLRFRAVRDLVRLVYGLVFWQLTRDLGAVARLESVKTLAECFQDIGQGRLSLSDPRSHTQIGAAFLRQLL